MRLSWSNAVAWLAAVFFPALAAVSCGESSSGSPPPGMPDAEVDAKASDPSCDPVATTERIPQRTSATVADPLDTFANLAGEVEIQCGNCHKAPAQQGGFSYDGTREGLCTAKGAGGKTPAQMMIEGLMPKGIGGQQPLGRKLQAWIDQGCSSGTYKLPKGDAPVNPGGDLVTSREVGAAMTELGNCIPKRSILGQDEAIDARFAAVRSFADLPVKLSETDVVSLDSEALARKGTIAYAPAYPLWTDDAGKLRFVHVPAGKSIAYDAQTKHFVIPSNTRFYKTFLKAVTEADGVTRHRKLETRIIVTRDKQEDAIYGTYVWNAEETGAKLLGTGLNPDAPDQRETYLDGKPFPDYVRPYTTDERTGATRSYSVPGSERCIACHTGSEGQNFVLGFTPLQIHRRAKGEGGILSEEVLGSDRDQAERLIAYGVVTGITAAELPKLEESAMPRLARNQDELRMQAYMVGNCAHCHNPNGYAVRSYPGLRKFNMAPGGSVFGFDFKSSGSDNLPYFAVTPASADSKQVEGALANSRFYARTVLPTGAFDLDAFGLPKDPRGLTAFFNFHMPLHTPGIDCRLPVLLARWWGSVPRDYDRGGVERPDDPFAVRAARIVADIAQTRAQQDCKPPPDLQWVLEDTTERNPYLPRNIDWPTKMDPWIRALEVTPEHEALAKKVYHQGYFEPNCKFPSETPPPAAIEPWMIVPQSGQPRGGTWSLLYSTNPGQHIFAGVCSHCHGVYGDAQTGAARALRASTGARVASFVDGMVGPKSHPSANIHCFDEGTGTTGCHGGLGPNGAAKYLTWMANGGTTISFGRTPEEEATFFDAFVTTRALVSVPIPIGYLRAKEAFTRSKANMLGVARATCDGIRTDAEGLVRDYDKAVADKKWDQLLARYSLFGVPMWRDVCTLNNPLTDALRRADADSPEVRVWLQKAIFNAGTMVFLYLRDELSKGVIAAPRNACEIKYPSP